MPGALPNTNNKPNLNNTQSDVADASIKNFLKGVAFPPKTAEDRAKMKAAIEAFRSQIKKVKEESAKKNNTAGKTGKAAATQSLAAQQTTPISITGIPGLGNFFPAGTDLSKTSVNAAVNSMEATIARLEGLVKVPAIDANLSAGAIQAAASQVPNLSTISQAVAAAAAAAAAKAQIQPKQTIAPAGGASS